MMQRELKFRAWVSSKMVNIDVMALSACLWSCPDYGTQGISIAIQPHIHVMQYTGLNDKNGKEIYEGDIISDSEERYEVKRGLFDLPDSQLFGCYGVYIESTGFGYVDPGIHGLLCENDPVQVIGNIYENPELLEVK